jgi:hypothetical protein
MAVCTAFFAVSQAAKVLNDAVMQGKDFEYVISSGDRELPPVRGADGKLYLRGELDGSYEIRIRVAPPGEKLALAKAEGLEADRPQVRAGL